MKVTGSATVAAPRERVYAALRDPAVLARTIPGCQGLETVGPDTYRLTVSAGVAAIRGTYSGSVALSDPEPPTSFVLRARGQGAPGTVDATVRVLLSDDGGTGTRVEYDADATVGGMVGGVGQRLLAGAARKTAAEFFDAVARDLTGPAAEMPDAHPDDAAPGIAPRSRMPVRYRDPARTDRTGGSRSVVAGVVAGAAAALAGVALGAAITRRAGRRP